MIQYRLRPAFRIAAWIPAVFFMAAGSAFVVLGVERLPDGPVFSLGVLLFGGLAVALGILFAKVAWTGLVSAAVEEYGLDDPADIDQMRANARLHGRLKE